MKQTVPMLCLAVLLSGSTASASPSHRDVFERDTKTEQVLKYQADADQVVTPARFFKFVNTLMGIPYESKPSAFEFQPIVNVHDGMVRAVGAIAYKF